MHFKDREVQQRCTIEEGHGGRSDHTPHDAAEMDSFSQWKSTKIELQRKNQITDTTWYQNKFDTR